MKIKYIFFIVFFILFNISVYGQTASLEEINRNIRSEEVALKKLQSEKSSVTKQIGILASKISNYRTLISEINKERKNVKIVSVVSVVILIKYQKR